MNLFNKYRPKSFDEIIGNETTVSSLKALLDREESRPHIFLLHGSKGTGKTTLARIIAATVGCHKYDLMEMNFADTRGIDTVREIIEHSEYMPRYGKVRVWIIDEIHQATKEAMNSMLKILEEPPKHVYFVLCTTDPQKIISTVRDRCYDFQMAFLTEDLLLTLIERVLSAENKKLSDKIKQHIAEKANGSARSCLVLLDKLIDVPETDLTKLSSIIEDEESEIKQLCQYFLKKGKSKWTDIAKLLKTMKQEPETIRYAVLGYMNAVLLNSGNAQASFVIECFSKPLFYTGKAGLTQAAYEVFSNE